MLTRVQKYVAGVIATSLTLVSTGAHAALPLAISTELAVVQTDALALADLIWPVVIAIFGAIVMFKLFKRFGSKI